mgnify:CR=1 FL=1
MRPSALEGWARHHAVLGATHEPADVACVALNRLPPRYIRHEVDFAFYLTDRERIDNERSISEAVNFAFEFVQARAAMRASSCSSISAHRASRAADPNRSASLNGVTLSKQQQQKIVQYLNESHYKFGLAADLPRRGR